MKITPVIILLFVSLYTNGQEKESFYVFDGEWKPTKIEYAAFFLHVHFINDTCWQWDYYNFNGPLKKTEQYSDKDGSELHGISTYYNAAGFLDSTSKFRKGKRNGDSFKFQPEGSKYKTKYSYLDDSLIETIDLDKNKQDSAKKYGDEKESEYPGGIYKWSRYINESLKYPERAYKNNFIGDVRVGFTARQSGYRLFRTGKRSNHIKYNR